MNIENLFQRNEINSYMHIEEIFLLHVERKIIMTTFDEPRGSRLSRGLFSVWVPCTVRDIDRNLLTGV